MRKRNLAQVRRSDERAVWNEKVFREANERIRAAGEELGRATDLLPVICECEEESCTQIVRVPLADYDGYRNEGGRFIVARGHRTRGHVVGEEDGFVVVEKDLET